MRKIDDFVEIESGFFIERKKYNELIYLNVLPWEMKSYLDRMRGVYQEVSQIGKPLKFQRKLEGDSK